jgi:hypothetical protein
MGARKVVMKRLLVMIVLGTLVLGVVAAARQGSYTLRGRVGATEQESQEGYFAIDNQTMIVVKPNTEFHAFLRARVGQRIRLVVEPDTGPSSQ